MKKLFTKVLGVLFVASLLMLRINAVEITTLTQAMDTIRINVGMIIKNKGKTKNAIANRSAANKEINSAMAYLKKDKDLIENIRSLELSIKQLNTMAADPKSRTTNTETKIAEQLSILTQKEVERMQKIADSRKDKIAKLLQEDELASQKEAVEAEGLMASMWKRGQKAYGSARDYFYTTRFAAGYHSTPEEKAAARVALKQLLADRNELLEAQKVATDPDERASIRTDLADINAQIREQQIILGEAYTRTRQALWATAGAAGLAGIEYKYRPIRGTAGYIESKTGIAEKFGETRPGKFAAAQAARARAGATGIAATAGGYAAGAYSRIPYTPLWLMTTGMKQAELNRILRRLRNVDIEDLSKLTPDQQADVARMQALMASIPEEK